LLGLPVDQLGKQDISIWLTIVVGIVVGIVAALIGSAIVGPLRDTDGVDWVEPLCRSRWPRLACIWSPACGDVAGVPATSSARLGVKIGGI